MREKHFFTIQNRGKVFIMLIRKEVGMKKLLVLFALLLTGCSENILLDKVYNTYFFFDSEHARYVVRTNYNQYERTYDNQYILSVNQVHGTPTLGSDLSNILYIYTNDFLLVYAYKSYLHS